MPWGTSVYCLTPPTADFLRDVCTAAGVHVYSDQGDVIRANESFVMIHAVTSGMKTIRLQGPRTVRNLATDEVTKNVSSVTLPMKEGETIVLQLSSPL